MRPSSLPRCLIVCFGLLRRAGGWIVWSAVIACPPVQAAPGITLLLSEPAGIYQAAAQALEKELMRDAKPHGILWRHVDARPSLPEADDELIVALGVRALNYALDSPGGAPVFAVLVPSQTFEKLVSTYSSTSRQRTISGLFLDQPYARQLQLIRLALPDARRVGVLVGATTANQTDALARAGREVGLDVRVHRINNVEQLFNGLTRLARDVDVLLLLPDPQVVSGQTLRVLFLQTYQLRLPVVAYAASLLQAGATIGLYAMPAQLGSEAGKQIREMLGEKGASKTQTRFPRLFTIEINRNVARTLELPLPSIESLNTQLARESGR